MQNPNIIRFLQILTVASFGMSLFNTYTNAKAIKLDTSIQALNGKRDAQQLKIVELTEKMANSQNLQSEALNKLSTELNSASDYFKSLNDKIVRLTKIVLDTNKNTNITPEQKDKILEENLDQLDDLTNKSRGSLDGVSHILDEIKKGNGGNSSPSNYIDSITETLNNINSQISSLSLEESIAFVHISGSIIILISLFSLISVFYGNYLINALKLSDKYPKLKKYIDLRLKFQHYFIWFDFFLIFFVLLSMIFIDIYILL